MTKIQNTPSLILLLEEEKNEDVNV